MVTAPSSSLQDTNRGPFSQNLWLDRAANSSRNQNDQSANASIAQSLKDTLGVDINVSQNKPLSGFDAKQVANTVLSFIEERVSQAMANGASNNKIKNMMSDAREGIQKGFGQARDQIEALGKMHAEIEMGITNAKDTIYLGLNELERELNIGSQGSTTTSILDRYSDVLSASKASFQQKSTFEFELFTQEGDRVTISAFQDHFMESSFVNAKDSSTQTSMDLLSSNNAQGYQLNIQGDLNESEKQALNSLFIQIDKLSSSFYSGDIETAFNLALSLTGDASQIAEFSLNMKQVESVGYQQSNYVKEQEGLPHGLAVPLQGHAKSLLDMIETARVFQNPFELVHNLLEKTSANQSIHQLNQALFDSIND